MADTTERRGDASGPIVFLLCALAMLLSLPIAGWLGRRDVRKFREKEGDYIFYSLLGAFLVFFMMSPAYGTTPVVLLKSGGTGIGLTGFELTTITTSSGSAISSGFAALASHISSAANACCIGPACGGGLCRSLTTRNAPGRSMEISLAYSPGGLPSVNPALVNASLIDSANGLASVESEKGYATDMVPLGADRRRVTILSSTPCVSVRGIPIFRNSELNSTIMPSLITSFMMATGTTSVSETTRINVDHFPTDARFVSDRNAMGRSASEIKCEYDSPITPSATANSKMCPTQVQNGSDSADTIIDIVDIYRAKRQADMAAVFLWCSILFVIAVFFAYRLFRR